MAAGATNQAPAGSGDSPAVFSRQASGLIRVAGSWDVFIFNIGLVSIGIAIAFNQYYGPSLYPGASVWVSTLLAALGMLAVAATFYFWSVIFPRSGGIYVFLSRSTRPGLAFVLTVLESVILLYYGALAASLIAKVGLSSFFATVGAVAGSDTLLGWAGDVATPSGVFLIGSAVLLIAGTLLATGTRRYFSVQRVLFVVAVVTTLVLLAVMLFGSRSGFQANLTKLTGLEYDAVIAKAEEGGYATKQANFGDTLKFLVWPLLPLLGAIQSIALGGEIKRVRRSQLLGMLGAVAASGLVIAVFALLSSKAFGDTFQGAVAFNSLNGAADASTEAATGAAPFFTVLAGILTDNVVLAVIVMAMFVTWIWFWIPAEIAYTTRTMIAWSFDRLAPDRLGYVSPRFNTPVVAIGLSTLVALVFMWLIAYRNIALLTMIEALLIVWGVTLAMGMVFPWVGRRFFDRSPARNFRFAGLPAMAITGAIATAFFALAVVLLWRDPIAAGPLVDFDNLSTGFWIMAGTLVAAIAWYVGTKIYRRRQGIDIELAFREIPIE